MRKQRNSSSRRPAALGGRRRRALALVSGFLLVLLTLVCTLAALLPLPRLTRLLRGSQEETAVRQVASTTRRLYCPQSLGLSDSGSYGDASFRASAGNLESSRTLVTIGSVYEANATPVRRGPAPPTRLALPVGNRAGVSRGQADAPLIAESRQLSSTAGQGLAGSVASWASSGDVPGLAAASCIAASSRAHFLLPGTRVGQSARLIATNPSDKPTVLSLRLWGSSHPGPIHPAAASQVPLAAGGSTTISLDSLAGRERAVLVEVDSSSVAVFASVETSAAAGLTPKGVDYSPSLAPTRQGTITGLGGGLLRLLLFSPRATRVRGFWLTPGGEERVPALTGGRTLPAARVVSLSLGHAPRGAQALAFSAGSPVAAGIVQTVSSGHGQEDYSLLAPQEGARVSALALPGSLSGRIVIASAQKSAWVRLQKIGGNGALSRGRTVSLPARASESLPLSSLGGGTPVGVLATVQGGNASGVTCAASLTSPHLSERSVAQSAVLPFTSLMPTLSRVIAIRSPLAGVSGE